MKKFSIFLILILILNPLNIFSKSKKFKSIVVKFQKDVYGAEARDFISLVGTWHIDRDGKNLVYAVDGRKWERGVLASGIAEKAKMLYGERYAEFLDNLEAYKYFPLSVFKRIKTFKSGIIAVSFKAISGRIDRAAGIAFDIKKNGDYLVARANPLENNIVLFRMKNGKRSVVRWIRNVPQKSKRWYRLKVKINGRIVRVYLNKKLYIKYKNKTPINGKIGLWSKSDSYVFFDDFYVKKER